MTEGARCTEGADRERVEAELRRVNRALRMLSECNQALVRSTDEAGLLDAICRIVVDVGGYRLAWVGYKEEDAAKTVQPVAYAGSEQGYLETLAVTWADTERGRGPTGVCIRTGQPVSARHILTDPSYAPWRAEALKRGYASSLVIPLLTDKEIVGALNIYSVAPDAFDSDEVTLLSELGSDLAYGIVSLRTQVEQSRVELALRESELKHRTLFETAGDAIMLMRGDRFIDCNARTLAMFGCTREQIVDAPPYRFSPPRQPDGRDSAEKALEMIHLALTQGPQCFEWEHCRADRSPFAADVSLNQLEISGEILLQAIVRDVDDDRRAKQQLAESEQRYRELVEHANSIILRWTHDGRITFLNEFGLRCFGYTSEEIVGRHVMGTIVPATDSHGRDLRRLMDQICANPAAFEQNINENTRRNGERIWVAWTNRIVFDSQGQVNEILSVGTDITERKRAEEAIRELNANLEQRVAERTAELAVAKDRAESADRLKSAFLANMSHELRTPLNSIIGFSGVLLQGLAGPLNPEQRKQLGMVCSSADHLLALINDVLDLSKIEAGQMQLTIEPFDLRASVVRVVGSASPLAERKGVTLAVDFAPGITTISSDRRRVEQVLLNLLSNGIKFTEHGSVRVEVSRAGDRIVVAVTDTGIGMKEQDLVRLFKPFTQLDAGITRKHEGTGLGLSICSRLVELLRGTIQVKSAWGKGSTFTLELPIEGGKT
jgi:PAS domain S-box-containing protein